MSKIGIRIKADLKVNGVPIDNASPQDPLFDDIVNEVGSDSTYIGKIDKIVLVDNTGAEKDSLTSITYSYPASNQVQLTGTISITSNYTVSYVRAYSGTKKYFEASWSKSVASGDTVDVTLTVTVNTSGSISGSTTGSIALDQISPNIVHALGGDTSRQQIGLKTVKVFDSSNVTLFNQTFSRTVDTTNNKVTGDTGVQGTSATGSAVAMEFYNSGGAYILRWTFNTAVTISANTSLRVQYTFSVS
jgi:hypothetical protein